MVNTLDVAAKATDVLNIDPAPGNQYLVAIGAGSPELGLFGLPSLAGIGGWALRYHDDEVWSDFAFILGGAQFSFANGADAVEFFPTDALGNRIFNPFWFDYQARFATDGGGSLFQASVNNVSEPVTVVLFGLAFLALVSTRSGRSTINVTNFG